MYIYTHTCTYIHTHSHIYICIHMYMYVFIYTNTYVYMCVYIQYLNVLIGVFRWACKRRWRIFSSIYFFYRLSKVIFLFNFLGCSARMITWVAIKGDIQVFYFKLRKRRKRWHFSCMSLRTYIVLYFEEKLTNVSEHLKVFKKVFNCPKGDKANQEKIV